MTGEKKMERVQRGFIRVEQGDIAWYSVPSLLEEGVIHGVTTRQGGVSVEPRGLSSLNLGWSRPDNRENVAENYRRLAHAAGFTYSSMALVNYEHGASVCEARPEDAGKGFDNGKFDPCDGLVTNSNEVTLITLHADCLPVFLYAPRENVGALLHAGWKGVQLGIAMEAVRQMQDRWGCAASELLAAVGPGISRARFEVDQPVVDRFRQSLQGNLTAQTLAWLEPPDEREKYHIDLPRVVVAQLVELGVVAEKITLADICTYDRSDEFFSYRRDGATCGSMAGFLRLR